MCSSDLKDCLIGCSKHKFGFEGLTDNPKAAFECFGHEAVFEKASIEEIMIYLERGRHNGLDF